MYIYIYIHTYVSLSLYIYIYIYTYIYMFGEALDMYCSNSWFTERWNQIVISAIFSDWALDTRKTVPSFCQ